MATLRFKDGRHIALDLAAFSMGLALAWWLGWNTGDLVWGLWLSSLLVGLGTIVFAVAWAVMGKSVGEGLDLPSHPTLRLLAGLFSLLFFLVHFGGFHVGHAILLNAFFPLLGEGESWTGLPLAILSYLPFVAMLAWGEWDRVVKAVRTTEMLGPYKNVVRMHLLIFVFAFAGELGGEHFLVFLVVYVVYFFPLQRGEPATVTVTSAPEPGIR
jgi:TRAP-type mannitol/chloroaromatic compound transport system permease small subunit